MAKLIAKLNDGRELYSSEMQDVEVKAVGDHEIEMVGSTASIDRDNEVLSIEGWDLKNYKKNPVVLEAHNYWEPAIGRAKVRIEDKKMIFKIEFPPEGVYPRADLFRKLYKLGFMKASSVGFIPSEYKLGNGNDEPRRTFLKQELTEISLVTVPANPEALLSEKSILSAKEKGILNDADWKNLEALVVSVAAGVLKEKAKPEGAEFKSFAAPEEEAFATGLKNNVAPGKKAGDNIREGTNVTLKELLEKEPDILKAAVESAVKKVFEGEDFKEAVAHAISEIKEDKKFKALVLGDPAPTEPKGFDLKGADFSKAVSDVAKEVVNTK